MTADAQQAGGRPRRSPATPEQLDLFRKSARPSAARSRRTSTTSAAADPGGNATRHPVGKVLLLTLTRQWFELVASGAKREEYRELKPYWHARLASRTFDAVRFQNGYSANAPAVLVKLLGIGIGIGVVEWGAPEGKEVYILRLGAILEDKASTRPLPPSGR